MNEKNETTKTRQAKSLNSQKETLGAVREVHKEPRQKSMLHMRKEGRGKRNTLRTFHTEVNGWLGTIFPRGELPRTVLQLQHQLRGEPIYIRGEARKGESFRTIFIKECHHEVVYRGLPVKDRILHKVK